MGLLHAVKKYNPYKGTRFSTYSSFWIRAYILKFIMDSWSMVKVGTTQAQRRLFYRLRKEKKKLEDMGVFPAPQLLADALDVKVHEVEEMDRRLSYSDISLDYRVFDEGEETFVETLRADDDVEEAAAAREKSEILRQKVSEFKKMLNPKELVIFEQRIMTEDPRTLQELGERFGVSRERVRQLGNRVLRKFATVFERELKALGLYGHAGSEGIP